jgi:hypothetical protein
VSLAGFRVFGFVDASGVVHSINKHPPLMKHIANYFRTRSPVSAADIDGWRARELMAPLFMGDDEELQVS